MWLMVAKAFLGMVVAGATVLGLATGAALAGPADDAIKARQGCMKAHGASMKVIVPMIKGAAAYDSAAVQATLDNEGPACAGWSDWWGPDTQMGETVKTHAKPEIWSDPKGFEEAGGKWYAAYQAVKATTDEAGLKAAFPALGQACQGCHEKYRMPME
jgi:cytochrome c556